ncbi:DDE-type integrase/transposase/recombinase [Micromonospora sp. NPDC048830]|uniref:DDE-type integrase/transposase/recombinase n=1 Tax=Micromonospora sp. NPDC048830 TaxID=3364257 RepID=UPI003722CF2F
MNQAARALSTWFALVACADARSGGDKRHLDEVFFLRSTESGSTWRTVVQDGDVLDILVTARCNTKAARWFFRKLLKKHCAVPSWHFQIRGEPVTLGNEIKGRDRQAGKSPVLHGQEFREFSRCPQHRREARERRNVNLHVRCHDLVEDLRVLAVQHTAQRSEHVCVGHGKDLLVMQG